MTWEVKVLNEFERELLADSVDEVCDRLEEEGVDPQDEDAVNEVAWDSIHEVVDGRFAYTVDQLAAILYYGHVDEGMNATWEDLERDIVERACEKYAQD